MEKSIKTRKEILLIRANNSKFGGAEVYLSRLASELCKQKINHRIIRSPFPAFLPSWLRSLLFNAWLKFYKDDQFYFSLERITCPDVYRAGDGVHKVFLSIEKKSKFNLLHPVYLYLEKRCFQKAKLIIVNSKMVKNQIIKEYGIDLSKIILIRNGIPNKKVNFENSYVKLTKEFSLNKKSKVILYVGSGFRRKGVEQFLKIIAKLTTKNFTAFVVGKEKSIHLYQDLAKKLQLENKVFFTGPREDVDDFYTISDIFLFPTHYEPFSNVILEAMQFENAVFTTKSNGASEILDNDFIMKTPDDFSISLRIDQLLLDNDKLLEIKRMNRLKSKQFSIEKNLNETITAIDEIIN